MSPTGSTGMRRDDHQLDLPTSFWVIVSTSSSCSPAHRAGAYFEEGDVLLAAPDPSDVGQVTQGPFASLAPDGPRRGHRLQDDRGGDPQAPQLGGELWEVTEGGDVGALVEHETQGGFEPHVGEAAAWCRAVSTTSSTRAATIGATECCAPGEPMR